MSSLLPPRPQANGLRIATTVFCSLGFPVWGTSIGFILGWTYEIYMSVLLNAVYITVGANVGMIYVGARLIFNTMDKDFPSATSVKDLQQNLARMVAFTILGFTTWINSIVWLAQNTTDAHVFVVFHACNYGFLIGILVAGLAGGVLRKVSGPARRKPTTTHLAEAQPSPPHPHASAHNAHYNPAYSHYGGGQRIMYN